ncbi:hydroxymethylglutaryl-CoA synthase, partial [Gilvibacter sp.]|uniref:hydroxymethylglutaryl-CoA synthase n=1 Tax=Gilvibacter sp. TaxID=2729997 RepID=UPI0035BE26C7
AVAKSSLYTKFVSDHIEITERASSVIGNMYTASIFMALVSLLMHAQEDGIDLTGKSLGFIAYGSGSKSKVFQGEVLPSWKAGIANMDLKKQLQARKQVDIKTYQQLHTGAQQQPLVVSDDIVLTHIESEKETAIGLRTYAQNKA